MAEARSGWAGFLPLLAAFVYVPFLGGEFLLDDFPLIAENPHLRLGEFGAFFSRSLWANTALPPVSDALYRPVALLYYWLVWSLGGGAAWFFHAVAAALLALNGVLVARLARRWLPEAPPAAAAAAGLIYALHPAHVQAVLWGVGGAEELAAALVLACLLAYGRNRVFAGVLFLLALLTKEAALALPAFLALWPLLQRREAPYPLRDVALFAGISGAYLALRAAVVGFDAVTGTHDAAARLGAIMALMARHSLAPWPQPFWLETPAADMAAAADFAFGGAVLLALAAAAWRFPRARAGLVLAVCAAAPVAALAFMPGIGVFAMRYLVLPLAGVALALAAGLARLYAVMQPAFLAAVAAVAVLEAAVIGLEAPHWHDETRLAAKILHFDPAGPKGYDVLAGHASRRGDGAAVVVARLRAVGAVRDELGRCEVLEKLALAQKDAGKFEGSFDAYRLMTAQCANAVMAARAWVGVGNNLWVMGRLDEALEAYRTAVAKNPRSFLAVYNAGNLHETMGHTAEAVSWYRRVLTLPRSEEWDAAAYQHAKEMSAR